MQVFGVFEGGGAKGLAHVGALRAMEERDFRFCAVAGTSIGAVIAALIASGFRSNELFTVEDGVASGLLSEDLERRLLDADEYGRFCRLRDDIRRCVGSGDGLVSRLFGRMTHNLPIVWLATSIVVDLLILAYPVHRRVLRDLWRNAGAVGTDRFRNWLDETISEKLGLDDGRARYRDLPIDLRIVATNLTKGDGTVFSRRSTPDAIVADAVAASMAYPILFKPVLLDGSFFADGGLSSNAPAWVLDDLREEAVDHIPTFAFRLLDTEQTAAAQHQASAAPFLLWRAITRYVPSSLNSRTTLETRRIDDFHLMKLNTGVGTLDFEAVNRNKAALVETGAAGVAEYLSKQIGPRDPHLMESALRAFISVVEDITLSDGTIRAYLIQSVDAGSCRVVYSALLEGDADDALTMRLNSRSQAMCLVLREPVMMRTSSITTRDRLSPATKYVHSARPTEVTHVYSCPIFAAQEEWSNPAPTSRGEPIAALCFDFRSDDDHILLDPLVEDCIAAIAQVFGEFWTERELFQPTALAQHAGAASADWTATVGDPGFFVSARKERSPPPDHMTDRLENIIRRLGG